MTDEHQPHEHRSGDPSESPTGPGELQSDDDRYAEGQDEAEQGDKDT